MTTTILTDEQIVGVWGSTAEPCVVKQGNEYLIHKFARAIEQAVLQSPEVQALISAAQEFSDLYGWLWDTTDGGGFLSPDGVKRYDAAHHKLRVALFSMTGKPLPIDPDED